jgi:Holliday junction resolvase-like predicted endonuclease
MMRKMKFLQFVKKKLKEGKLLEDVVEELDWKDFEQLVSEILIENNFFVKQNFRFKTKKRYEIDLVSVKNKIGLCVDCKEWSGGRYKKSAIRRAAKNQEKRMKELVKFLRKNPIAKHMLKIDKRIKFYPLIITWQQEDLIQEKDTFIVPIYKLNSFLLEIENYLG